MATSTLVTRWLVSPPLAAASSEMVDIPENTAWSLAPRRGGVEIRCESGVVWVTVEGDPEDHVLVAPRALLVRSRGRVAAQALEDSRISVGRV